MGAGVNRLPAVFPPVQGREARSPASQRGSALQTQSPPETSLWGVGIN